MNQQLQDDLSIMTIFIRLFQIFLQAFLCFFSFFYIE